MISSFRKRRTSTGIRLVMWTGLGRGREGGRKGRREGERTGKEEEGRIRH